MPELIHKSDIIASYNNIAHERDRYKNDTWEVNERIKFIKLLQRKGVLEGDNQIPKRFFNAYTDEQIKKVVSQSFEIVEYNNIDVKKNTVYLQSIILRK